MNIYKQYMKQFNNYKFIWHKKKKKKNQFTSLCRGQGLLQKYIWH